MDGDRREDGVVRTADLQDARGGAESVPGQQEKNMSVNVSWTRDIILASRDRQGAGLSFLW